ncbi:hypothetical protein DFP72DRAFT_843327 [Ephemerocybe angulata]|uniref:Uncharacterized protein n=1 Tax=Ephemerocybe angulata TaxID=980116 RepID=A0A8H6I9N1_9AGAR|nr:hypothetical protein DFP72DRAFT_843327 [Tulosesus angulatus]
MAPAVATPRMRFQVQPVAKKAKQQYFKNPEARRRGTHPPFDTPFEFTLYAFPSSHSHWAQATHPRECLISLFTFVLQFVLNFNCNYHRRRSFYGVQSYGPNRNVRMTTPTPTPTVLMGYENDGLSDASMETVIRPQHFNLSQILIPQ